MDPEISKCLTPHEMELRMVLTQLGLAHYKERLSENGFDDWETVTAIEKTDMMEIGFTLGHRRKLQRAIKDR
jgi:hypothetical protein